MMQNYESIIYHELYMTNDQYFTDQVKSHEYISSFAS